MSDLVKDSTCTNVTNFLGVTIDTENGSCVLLISLLKKSKIRTITLLTKTTIFKES